MIPAEIIFDQDRLRCIQPQFSELYCDTSRIKPKWVKQVVRLRKAIWPYTGIRSLSLAKMLDRLQAIKEIIQQVAPDCISNRNLLYSTNWHGIGRRARNRK